MTKPMNSFEVAYPNITLWVKDCGTVEIGYDPGTDSFIRALDEGGMVRCGKSHYPTLDDGFRDLEEGLRSILTLSLPSPKPSARTKVSAKAKKSTDKKPNLSPEPNLPKQVHKLDAIVEAIRGKEKVEVTRLTVVKKLCEHPEAAGAFAMFLAQQAQGRLSEKHGKERYVQLADRAVREMKSYLDHPTEDCKMQLRSLLLEIQAEQNEYVSIQWSAVRSIKSWDLLIVENALRTILIVHLTGKRNRHFGRTKWRF